jgi:electron transport complex protein RnfD
VRDNATTGSLMRTVIIALIPAVLASFIIFGLRAVILTAVCVAASVLFEYLFERLMKRDNTVHDLSAVVTGLLIAMNVPATLPPWIAVIGCFVAIVIVKQLFGGIGQNFCQSGDCGPDCAADFLCHPDDQLGAAPVERLID